MLALIGFFMMVIMIWLLLSNRTSPIVVFIAIPIVIALLLGFSFEQVTQMVESGIMAVVKGAIMMLFSVLFFSVLAELGSFDFIVNSLVNRAGNRVSNVILASMLITLLVHISGSVASTVLIVIPTMMPIYKNLGIKPIILLCIVSIGVGVMNLVPWCGGMVRAASVLGLEPIELWSRLAPVQLVGIFVAIFLALIIGRLEEGRINQEENDKLDFFLEEDSSKSKAKKPLINGLISLLVILTLVSNIMPSYLVFMLGLSLVLIINYPSLKEQTDVVDKFSGSALIVSVTMLAAGVMVGILRDTGMLNAMSEMIVSILPGFLGRYIHIIFGLLGLPLGIVTGADAYFYGLMPLILDIGIEYGVPAINTGISMVIARNMSVMISPLVGSAYLATRLTNIDLADHIKFSGKWIYALSLILVVSSFILGVVDI